MSPTTTRSRFDVRVGSIHTLEVLLQIRSSDLTWWDSNLRDHERQLYKLIGRRIVPLELNDEIQNDIARELGDKIVTDANAKTKKVVIGEVNLKKMTKSTNSKKRGNESAATKGKSKTKKMKAASSKDKQIPAALAIDKDDTIDSKDKRPKLLREMGKWIMGKSIQVCYVMEDIDRTTSCSMAFRPVKQPSKENELTSDTLSLSKETDVSIKEEKLIPLATFRSWIKLSKRLNVWVFKFDPNDPTDLSATQDGGFPRPELLPLSDIFR